MKASFFPLVFGAWFYKNEFLIKQVNYLFKAINFNAKKGIFHGGGECSSHHDRCLPQPRISCCGLSPNVFYYFLFIVRSCGSTIRGGDLSLALAGSTIRGGDLSSQFKDRKCPSINRISFILSKQNPRLYTKPL